jgi:hypothetical protein
MGHHSSIRNSIRNSTRTHSKFSSSMPKSNAGLPYRPLSHKTDRILGSSLGPSPLHSSRNSNKLVNSHRSVKKRINRN